MSFILVPKLMLTCPSIFYTAYPLYGCAGAGADPSWHWASSGVHPGQVTSQPTYRDRQPLTFTPTGNLESSVNLTCMSFWLWEEAGVPGENPLRHEENMQTPHRRAPVGQWVRTQNALSVRRQC